MDLDYSCGCTCELFPALISHIDFQGLQLHQDFLVVSQCLLAFPPSKRQEKVIQRIQLHHLILEL